MRLKENLILVFNKLIYVIEFILSIFVAIFMYNLQTTKSYSDYWPKRFLILTVVFGILLLAVMIYNIYKKHKEIEKLFVTLAIPIGIFYMIFMLPTYAPDESAHIWRAYEVSEGILFCKKDDKGKNYTEVPKQLSDYKQEVFNKYSILSSSMRDKTDYTDKEKLVSPAQGYVFFLYIPSSIGILITRILNLNILYGIYLGKIFNFIVFLIAGYWAIKKIPFGKLVMLVYMLMPMIMCQAVSISADSMINALILFYISYILSLLNKEKLSNLDKALCMILPIFISISKITYLPICMINFMLLKKKNLNKKEKIVIIGIGTIICIIVSLLWFKYTMSFTASNETAAEYVKDTGVNSIEQIQEIIKNPGLYIGMIFNTLGTYGQYYIDTLIGSQLGWLNIYVNKLIIDTFLVLVIIMPFMEKHEIVLDKKQKIWTILIAIATILLVITALYITWSEVGGDITVGVQGRYFIPVAILLLLCLCMKNNYIKVKNANVKVTIFIIILTIYTITDIYKFFI